MKNIKRKKQKRIINYIVIATTLGIIIWFSIQEYKDIQVKKEKMAQTESLYSTQNISTQYDEKQQKQVIMGVDKEYPKEEIPEQYKGYAIVAKLQIPKINLETYILKQYSKNALNVSVTKFWGVDPNQIGNFCVAGHNFQNKNMFHNLRNLEIGNQLTISDAFVGKVEYKIYDIYMVEPEDVSCLSQETNGKREVTLITCTTDSEKRIIVKAREVEP